MSIIIEEGSPIQSSEEQRIEREQWLVWQNMQRVIEEIENNTFTLDVLLTMIVRDINNALAKKNMERAMNKILANEERPNP